MLFLDLKKTKRIIIRNLYRRVFATDARINPFIETGVKPSKQGRQPETNSIESQQH